MMKDMSLRQKVAQLMVIRVPLNLEGQKQAVIVWINPLERTVRVVNFLVDRGTDALNYAFTW
jgi:hypothetical protein